MSEPELVGRDGELRVLTGALNAARSGDGGMVVVAGQAGIGKSRLLAETAVGARSAGMLVLRGRTGAGPASASFRPVAEALASGLRAHAVGATALRGFEPALGRLLPGWFPGGEAAAAPDLVFVAEAVLRLLRVMAGTRGVFVALEDLHWADPESIDLVSYLADNIRQERVLVAITVCDEPSSPAVEALRSAARHSDLGWLPLGRMADDELERIATARLGKAVPREVWKIICSRAEGIPLFAEELITTLADGDALGALDRGADHDQVVLRVPTSFQTSVDERLRRLGKVGTSVLSAAALLGRHFDTALLQAALQLSTHDLADALSAAARGGLVETAADQSPGWMRFRHALTRDAILELTPAPMKRELGEAALAAVRTAHPAFPGGWCEIAADLALTAGRVDEAVVLLRRLAERARSHGALGLARAMLDRASSVDGPPEQGELASVELLEVLAGSGRHDRAEELGDHLLRTLPKDGERAARVHLALAEVELMRLNLQSAEQHLTAASATSEQMRHRLGLLRSQLELARYRYAEAEGVARQIATEASAQGRHAVSCEALLLAGRATAGIDIHAAENTFAEALRLAEEEALPVPRAAALAALGGLDVLRVMSDERLLLARMAALDCGMTALVASLTHDLAMLALLRHDLAGGRRWAEETVADGRRYRLGWVLAAGLVKHAFAAALVGDTPAAEGLLAEAEPLAGGDPRGSSLMVGHVRAAAALNAEDMPAALDAATTAASLWWRHHLEPRPYLGLWVLLESLHGPDRLKEAMSRLELRSTLWQPTVRGLTLAARAVTAADDGRAAEAEALMGEALPPLERTPWFHAVACRYAGERLLGAGIPRGEDLLRTAITFFSAAGLEPPANASRALLRGAGRRVPRRRQPSAALPAPLAAAGVSAREMEVLLLVGQGLSNRQIGEQLFVSDRTVAHHLQAIFAKTGTPNRAALAGRLPEWGLAGQAPETTA